MVAVLFISEFPEVVNNDSVSSVQAASRKKINKKKNKKALKAYKKILSRDKYQISSTNDFKFDVYDINGDGVQELIIDSGGKYSYCMYGEVYTYTGGKAKKLKSPYSYGAPVIYSNGVIYFSYAHTGGYYFDYFRIKKGKQKIAARYYCHDGYNPKTGGVKFFTDECKLNGKKSSVKKYNKWVKNLERNARVITLDMHSNTYSNRNYYLK